MAPRKAMPAFPSRETMSPSPPLSVASRAASIPPPIHPDFKRKRTPSPELSPSKKRRGQDGAILRSVAKYGYDASDAFEYPSSGWIAISTVVPHDIELYPELDEESEEVEEEEDNNDDSCPSINSTPPSKRSLDDSLEVPDSSSSSGTVSPLILSPTTQNAPLPYSDAPLDDSNLPQATDPASDHLWNIDGLDVHAAMKKGSKVKLTPEQEKKVLLWMKINGARGITGHEESYNKLMAELKFSGQGHSKEVEKFLRFKVKGRINTLYSTLKNHGIVTDIEVDTKKWQENNKIGFANYTATWLREGWDGTIEVPRSWWAETVEWDGVSLDVEPEIFTVEEPPTLSTPQKSRRGHIRESVAPDAPVVDVLATIQQFWTKEISDAKGEADAKLGKDIWNHDKLYESQWNVAAVQAQHVKVDMSKKTLLTKAIDGLENVVESNQNSRAAKDMIQNPWEYGNISDGSVTPHEFASEIDTSASGAKDVLIDLLASSEPEVDDCNVEPTITPTPIRRRKITSSIASSRTQPEPEEVDLDAESTDAEAFSEEECENEDAAERVLADDEALLDEEEGPEEEHAEKEDAEEDYDDEDDFEEEGPEEVDVEEVGVEEEYADEEDNAAEEAEMSDVEMEDIDSEPDITQQALLTYEVIALRCDTYPKWTSQLREILSTQDAWGIISEDIKAPIPCSSAEGVAFDLEKTKYEKAVEEWKKKSDICLDWMLLTMSKEVSDAVMHIHDSLELWALLKEEFEVL